MNDRLVELYLAAWDRLMDWLSSGRWSEIRGEVRIEFRIVEE